MLTVYIPIRVSEAEETMLSTLMIRMKQKDRSKLIRCLVRDAFEQTEIKGESDTNDKPMEKVG